MATGKGRAAECGGPHAGANSSGATEPQAGSNLHEKGRRSRRAFFASAPEHLRRAMGRTMRVASAVAGIVLSRRPPCSMVGLIVTRKRASYLRSNRQLDVLLNGHSQSRPRRFNGLHYFEQQFLLQCQKFVIVAGCYVGRYFDI